MIVYKITHRESGRGYIGITKGALSARMRGHRKESKRQLYSYIARAIAKHGWAAFDVEHIASAKTQADLLEVEKILIAQHGTRAPAGYNLTDGGDGVVNLSPEARARIVAAHVGRVATPEERAKNAASQLGRKHTAETKAKIAAALTGRKREPFSAEWLANLSKARNGYKQSPEHVARRSAAFRKTVAARQAATCL